MRLTAVLLREDDSGLERRVCESERSVKTYSAAADLAAAGIRLPAESRPTSRYRGRQADQRARSVPRIGGCPVGTCFRARCGDKLALMAKRVSAWLGLILAFARAVTVWAFDAHHPHVPSDLAIQIPESPDMEAEASHAPVIEPTVAEVRPLAIPVFGNATELPPMRRNWQYGFEHAAPEVLIAGMAQA